MWIKAMTLWRGPFDKVALTWRQAYGTLFQFTHVYAHAGTQDRPPNRQRPHTYHLAIAGAKQGGHSRPYMYVCTLLVVTPGAPAGSGLHEAAPTQACDLSSQFTL